MYTNPSRWLSTSLIALPFSLFTLLSHASPLDQLDGVENADVSLNGSWHFQLPAPEEFWQEQAEPTDWKTMPVPGDVFREGHAIKEDLPFAYKKKISIPADFAGQQIRLRFEGAHDYTRVWVNGQFIRDHQGGWTPWECDITSVVKPGENAWIALELTDKSKDIAFNGKRLRPIGGLVRSVSLQARPKTFFEFPIVSSPFSDDGKTAQLNVIGQVAQPNSKATASFRLFDPAGEEVPLSPSTCALGAKQVTFTAPVTEPRTWTAEKPVLYRLEITSKAPGQATATYSKQIGFRDIRFDEKKNMLINGKVVKLRGANRHLVNPLKGFVPELAIDKRDAELFKEANMNFVRTSHYPPGNGFIEQCDRQGLYVTLETAVLDCGKANRPSVGMNDDPQYEKLFTNQLRETLLNYGSHPSVILWSICNESVYGANFQASYDYAHQQDPSRPVIASYQVKKDKNHQSYDVYSSHYPEWDADYKNQPLPTIYDEWMHVLGHTAELWFHDLNSRDYWGRSIDKAWANLFPADSSVGAAIWNFVDDMTIVEDPTKIPTQGAMRMLNPVKAKQVVTGKKSNITGTARWGIIDEWRRHKPEFWNVKKAYSPVRVLQTEVPEVTPNKPLTLAIYNRFDHTSLDEVKLIVSYDGKTSEPALPAITPHQKGQFTLPAQNWKAGSKIELSFHDSQGVLIDQYQITLGTKLAPITPEIQGSPTVSTEANQFVIQGDGVQYRMDKTTGLMKSIAKAGQTIPLVGPFPHIFKQEEYMIKGINPEVGSKPSWTMGSDLYESPGIDAWQFTKMHVNRDENATKINVRGTFAEMDVHYVFTFGKQGRFDVKYFFEDIPPLPEPEGKVSRQGPLDLEVGIKFQTSDQFDQLSWNKKAYWSYYPEGHLGAASGSIPLFSEARATWAQKPTQPWHKDNWDFYFMGWDPPAGKLLTFEAIAAKQALSHYTLSDDDAKLALTIHGDGKNTSARYGQYRDAKYYLYHLDRLDYHLRWGNYSADIRPKPTHDGTARFHLR